MLTFNKFSYSMIIWFTLHAATHVAAMIMHGYKIRNWCPLILWTIPDATMVSHNLSTDITISCVYWQVYIRMLEWLHLEPRNSIT